MNLKTAIKTNMNKTYAVKRMMLIVNEYKEELAELILEDSNRYIPVKHGTLRDSGQVDKGDITWSTPYAVRQYYEFEQKTSVGNPDGSWKWYEKAKVNHSNRWIELSKKYGFE